MPTIRPITITLDRQLLEHPQALHIRRMHAGIWLYLVLLARLPEGPDTVEVEPAELARAMGLPEGTVLSWLGHLRRGRYVQVQRSDGSMRVRIKRLSIPQSPEPSAPSRFFTVMKLERALDETGYRDALETALAAHPDPVIKRALAGALAVPSAEIRRSRTALFLYLLKHHAQATPNNDSRP